MKFILINRLSLQNANAISGFTANFIGITHVLGYTHNLQRKINQQGNFDITLKGCAVVCHQHHVHHFKNDNSTTKFTQSRNPRYMYGDNSPTPASVIEEGKMNATLSLIVGYEGNLTQDDTFCRWLENQCLLQKLAGGTVLDISTIGLYNINDKGTNLPKLKRKIMPGFMLYERSDILKNHIESSSESVSDLQCWMDFITLKQAARPKHDLLDKYFEKLAKEDDEINALSNLWSKHVKSPYVIAHDDNKRVECANISKDIIMHFSDMKKSKNNKALLTQWQHYLSPTKKTEANWSYIAKPASGYLVPLMTGYKAISDIMPNQDVLHVRDNETDVCFVEAVHTIGEWRSAHRLNTLNDLIDSLWHYHHEEHWYLCKQAITTSVTQPETNQPSKYY